MNLKKKIMNKLVKISEKLVPLVHTIKIPNYDKVIRFRPFVVKEYIAILQAHEMSSNEGLIITIKNIISDCLLDTDIDIDKLPMYIIDFIFLQLRNKSVGEIINLRYKCIKEISKKAQTFPDGTSVKERIEPCNTTFDVEVDLNKAQIYYPDKYNEKCIIKVNEDIGIKLQNPSFEKFHTVSIEGKDIFDITDEYIFACIDCIYYKDEVLLPGKDFSLSEYRDFINIHFPVEKLKDMIDFFKNQPRIMLELYLQCPHCKNESKEILSGLNDFFV